MISLIIYYLFDNKYSHEMSFEYYAKFSRQFFITYDFNPNDSITDMESKYYYYIDKSFSIDNILVQKNLQRATSTNDMEYVSFHKSLYNTMIYENVCTEKIKIKLKLNSVNKLDVKKIKDFDKIKTIFNNEFIFFKLHNSEYIEKHQFTKIINLYIKNNELQIDENRKMIRINHEMSELFQINSELSDTISLFNFHKIIR